MGTRCPVCGYAFRCAARGARSDGYLVELADAEDPDRPLSELEGVVSPVRVLPEALYRLARRVADRAAGSASDILRLVVPKRMVRAEKAWTSREAPVVEEAAPEVVAWAQRVLDAYPGLSTSSRAAVGSRSTLHRVPPTALLRWVRGRCFSVRSRS